MISISTNLAGRLRNTPLPLGAGLLPTQRSQNPFDISGQGAEYAGASCRDGCRDGTVIHCIFVI